MSQPLLVHRLDPRINARFDTLQVQRSALRAHLERFRPVTDLERLGGVAAGAEPTFPRAASPCPISPVPAPSDTVIYAHPSDPAVSYWLPRYRLRSANGVYEIGFAEQAGQWRFSFGLETYPAEEIAEAARTAQVLPHVRQVELRYGAGISRQMSASEVLDDDRGVTVAFSLTLAERDALLRAFQTDEAQAVLSVSRGIDVAVQTDAAPPTGPVIMVATEAAIQVATAPPELVFIPEIAIPIQHVEPQVVVPVPVEPGPRPEELQVEVTDLQPLRRRFLLPTAEHLMVPLARSVELAPETAVDHRIFARRASMLPRDSDPRLPRPRFPRPGFPRPPVVVDPPDPGPVVSDPGPADPPPAEPQYARRSLALESAIGLRFDPAVHPYLFGVDLGDADRDEFDRILLPFPRDGANSVNHAYFQDRSHPNVFHYLPDEFLLSRTTEAPYVPALAFHLRQGTAADEPTVEMNCYLRPAVSGPRLSSAQQELAARIPARAGLDPTPVLQPLVAKAHISLGLPGGARRLEDPVDLAGGFWVGADLTMPQFQEIFAVLASGPDQQPLMRGTVVASTGLSADDQIPVTVRYRHLAGEVFTSTETWDEASATMTVTLHNATESVQRVTALPTWLRRGEALVSGQVEGLTLPLDLARDGEVSFSVRPTAALPGSEPVDAVFDLNAVSSVLDPEVLLGLALDESVALETVRPLVVMTTEAQLGGAGDPARRIDTIVIEFRAGPPVVLDAAHLRVDAKVPVPLVDVLLKRDTGGAYEYRQTVVYATLPPKQDDLFRTSNRGVLVLPVD